MVWYPSVDDVIDANIIALDLTGDRHPHRLRVSRNGIQSIIDRVKGEEDKGLTYQAARLMRDMVRFHPFAGANHRTAYIVAKMFLRRNGRQLRAGSLEDAYVFIKAIGGKTIKEVQGWIEHGSEAGEP